MATDALAANESSEQGAATGNLYFDFDKNADDNTDGSGRTFPGLRRQLNEIRRRHFGAVIPDLQPGADILAVFRESFFPNGMTQGCVICNLSLQENQPYLAIRPRIIGPRLEQLMPRGMTLAVCARLWDSQRNPDNPVLLVQRVVDLSHSDVRPFERDVTAFVFHQSNAIYPASKRQQNVLTSEFISSLPLISVKTRERLQDWRAYLDWKERLIQANLVGLRYLNVDLEADGRYRFLVVAESKESFERARRSFRNNELRAFGLGYSKNPWDFQYNEDHRGSDCVLGDFAGHQELASLPPKADVEGMPWDNPYCAYVWFRLSEDAQNEYEAMVEGGSSSDEVAAHFRGQIHAAGFLALSVVGDISLVRRQRRELELLQQQSGYAPFLSSYLFDIRAAKEPVSLTEISKEQWFRQDLNDDQKLAVRRMIGAPDLAMVQGPPGTGKTTMIAEAIWQFVRQGKKVLVVSQANLAVDNALERLAHAPSVRAVRLGRKGEKDHPFHQTNVLRTYYQSISESCRQRTLSAWNEGDRRVSELSKWIADADLLSGDIRKLQQQEAGLSSEISSVEREMAARKVEAEQQRNVERLRQDAARFIDFLVGNSVEWSGTLPNEILGVFFDAVVAPIGKLVDVGIRLNHVWHQRDYGQPGDRARFAVEIFREWHEMLRLATHIKGDLARLQSTDADTVLAPEDAVRLGELNRRLQAAQQAMVDDASKLSEWQAIQKGIRDLKRKGSGLDRSAYERIFNGTYGGRQAHLAFIDPKAKRADVVALLEKVVSVLLDVEKEVSSGIAKCQEALDRYGRTQARTSNDPLVVRQLEGRLLDLSHKRQEVATLRKDKESRLVNLMRVQLQDPNNAPSSIDTFPHLRSTVVDRLQSIREQLDETREFRNAWEPVLRSWVSDLARPETICADQVNFLQTYIGACNVVGVTCTENRRTLEDNGHTRFDVVIVDEVSKATPPEIIMPLSLGRTAILVGDHRQLPPLFKEREGSWEEVVADREEGADAGDQSDPSSELTAENFERFRKMVTSSLFKEHFENAADSLKSFLFTQYRMHPQIMRVVNQFYENRLVCGLPDPDAAQKRSDPRGHRVHGMTLVGVRNLQYLKPEQHVLWLDSTTDPQGQKRFERKDGASSKVNDLEAAMIAKCLFDINEACDAQGYGRGAKNPKLVGVITFYGRQVRAIREAVKRLQGLRNQKLNAIRYDVNTVDRYQGQERPIVIVSMVRNPPWKLSARANTAQFERINVAFSRAQELLIITGAKDVFCSYPVDLPYLDRPGRRKVEVYRYIIDEIQRGGGFWKSDAVIDHQEFLKLLPREQAARNQPQRQGRR